VIFAFSSPHVKEGVRMADEGRITARILAERERLAQEGLRGGLLEQAWSRRALALVREIRLLWREAEATTHERAD
jgi:hypothetical protein